MVVDAGIALNHTQKHVVIMYLHLIYQVMEMIQPYLKMLLQTIMSIE